MPKQPKPRYPDMTTTQSPEILERLTERYGASNVCWPVIWYWPDTLQLRFLTFEVNARNKTNAGLTNRFFQRGQLPEYFIDYLASPPIRHAVPLTGQPFPDPPGSTIVSGTYASTYDYRLSTNNPGFSTIDLDYVWNTGNRGYRGLELTTFFVPMTSEERARDLVLQFIEKRAARPGAHQFRVLAEVGVVQHVELRLVFVNVQGKGSTHLLPNSNVFVIPINTDTAAQLHHGELPDTYRFLSFKDWITSL